MASGGSSGRPGSGSRSFDFGSDDVLCSYDDYDAREATNGKRPDTSSKDFHESRRGRPLVSVYSQEEEYSREDMISAVEKCMKKYADNLLRFLEGISGRLSQLETHCYKLERGINELRTDMSSERNEADTKLKSLEKHLQEVHRSVQILRDKQEIAETQKELAKIQLQQKVNPTPSPVKLNEGAAVSVLESQKHDDHDAHHLALALPHQISASNSIPARISDQQSGPASLAVQHDHYTSAHVGTYIPQYIQKPQVTNPAQVAPQQQTQIPNSAQQQALPQYQQQWPQQPALQLPQQVVPPPQSAAQAQVRPQNLPAYSPYPPHMSAATSIPEAFPISGIMHGSYSFIHPSAGARPGSSPYNYGSNMNKSGYLGSTAATPVMQQPNIQGFGNMYSSTEGGRTAHAPNFPPRSYTPGSALGVQSLPQLSSGVAIGAHPGMSLMSNQTYIEMIDKAVSMGYARDLVLNVIQRMSESGQLVDFNTLLDQLNAASGAPPRAWSG